MRVTPHELIQRLDAHLEAGAPKAMVFDADGTLWQGDVSEDVFLGMVRDERFTDSASAPLRQLAEAHGVQVQGSPSRMAHQLYEAHLAGKLPELDAYELMTWCYAGMDAPTVYSLVTRYLEEAHLARRCREPLRPIMDWARKMGVRVTVVSASPDFIVLPALEHWGIPEADVRGAALQRIGETLSSELAAPLPYREAKVAHASQMLGHHRWLAAFGDSAFDVALLRAADTGVAVAPKRELRNVLDKHGLLELDLGAP